MSLCSIESVNSVQLKVLVLILIFQLVIIILIQLVEDRVGFYFLIETKKIYSITTTNYVIIFPSARILLHN